MASVRSLALLIGVDASGKPWGAGAGATGGGLLFCGAAPFFAGGTAVFFLGGAASFTTGSKFRSDFSSSSPLRSAPSASASPAFLRRGLKSCLNSLTVVMNEKAFSQWKHASASGVPPKPPLLLSCRPVSGASNRPYSQPREGVARDDFPGS